MPKSKSSVPDRWMCYEPLGRCITGTRLFACKVPLRQAVCDNLPPKARFSPLDLIDSFHQSGFRLGLIIDLTNTTRYYNPQEFTQAGIEYHKLATVGHVIPHESIVQRFTQVVQDFLRLHSDEDLVIGVHCTHGVNRTGYVMCRYMIENLGLSAPAALAAFYEARGHKVERQNYIADLHKMSEMRLHPKATVTPSNHIRFDTDTDHCHEESSKAGKSSERTSNKPYDPNGSATSTSSNQRRKYHHHRSRDRPQNGFERYVPYPQEYNARRGTYFNGYQQFESRGGRNQMARAPPIDGQGASSGHWDRRWRGQSAWSSFHPYHNY